MSSRVYMKIAIAIDVSSDDKNKAEREARDTLYDSLPDTMTENIVDMDVIRIADINED